MLNSRMQYAARVNLADCFCPCWQGHRGVKNPRLFKDRPTDGKRSGIRRPLLNICVCNSVGNCRWPLPHFATRCGMFFRIMLLPTWSIKLHPEPTRNASSKSTSTCSQRNASQKSASICMQCPLHTPAQIFATHAAPSVGRSSHGIDPRDPPPKSTRNASQKSASTCMQCPLLIPAQIFATHAAPSVERSLNSRMGHPPPLLPWQPFAYGYLRKTPNQAPHKIIPLTVPPKPTENCTKIAATGKSPWRPISPSRLYNPLRLLVRLKLLQQNL